MLNKFNNLLSHLNAGDNDMAAEVRAVLVEVVEKVTETITVTKWKPILDENVPAYRPQQPQSKVCLPQQ